MSGNPSATDDAELSAVLGASALAFRQRASLYVRMTLERGMHVNGPVVSDGFVPIAVRVSSTENVSIEEPRYPPTHQHQVEGMGQVPVLDGDIEISVPIVSKVDTGTVIPIEIEVEYQACTATECLIPRKRRLHLEIPVVPLDQPRRRA
jgi:hypothetical protein